MTRRITIALLIVYALLTAYPLVSLALGASPMGIMTPSPPWRVSPSPCCMPVSARAGRVP
jgi:hypothetical protein